MSFADTHTVKYRNNVVLGVFIYIFTLLRQLASIGSGIINNNVLSVVFGVVGTVPVIVAFVFLFVNKRQKGLGLALPVILNIFQIIANTVYNARAYGVRLQTVSILSIAFSVLLVLLIILYFAFPNAALKVINIIIMLFLFFGSIYGVVSSFGSLFSYFSLSTVFTIIVVFGNMVLSLLILVQLATAVDVTKKPVNVYYQPAQQYSPAPAYNRPQVYNNPVPQQAYTPYAPPAVPTAPPAAPAANAQSPKAASQNSINELREYKKLLDEGIITQEDFDKKKTELLNL